MAPPVPETRLKEIAQEACDSALESASAYDHGQTEMWNNAIINSILQKLIQETTTPPHNSPPFKFAVNSTLVQHSAGGTDAASTSGRRGMHCATGAYWNEEKDGMWSFKWDGAAEKGMDVVVAVLWFSL